MKGKYITDTFKEFCRERHLEDKGKNYDLLQEIYSKTELFNLSYLNEEKKGGVHAHIGLRGKEFIVNFEELKDVALPFESMFIQLDEESRGYIFIREFEPNIYTGTFYVINHELDHRLNLPFTVKTTEGDFCFSENVIKLLTGNEFLGLADVEVVQKFIGSCAVSVFNCSNILSNLPKYSVASDTPTKSEYYPRKNNSTIKVTNRPIYYVMDKKEETSPNIVKKIRAKGHLEFTHAFSVRGHWRKINDKTIGKDRNGEYKVNGYTWVKEHVRGEGELVRRVRILK